ncbi:hypothetical protein TNCV_2206881 [Trichonephila clavipes]|uniref:Uncharacterized protein n=1 Tax=Trichonephila clavipes TaxID=2585209 RepID=A0A8X6V569_TRICX|nr:hypothetical protein TNCV_2206881 [Trichonephila clavipes]
MKRHSSEWNRSRRPLRKEKTKTLKMKLSQTNVKHAAGNIRVLEFCHPLNIGNNVKTFIIFLFSSTRKVSAHGAKESFGQTGPCPKRTNGAWDNARGCRAEVSGHSNQEWKGREVSEEKAKTNFCLDFTSSGVELILRQSRGRLEVKLTDSWPTCHEFDPNAAEDPPCTLNMPRFKRLREVVWKLGEGFQLRCRNHHFTMVQNVEVRPQKPLCS